MNERLKTELIEAYGTQVVPVLDEVEKRLSMSIAALLFAGNSGDNPLCQLNRIFEAQEVKRCNS